MPLKSLHQLLGSLENQYKPHEQQQIQHLRQSWAEVVGPVVAAQTFPLSIQRGILRVATSSSAWAQNLVFERQRILEKLNARLLMNLIDIRFSTAQWHESKTASTAPGSEQQAQLWREHPSRVPEVLRSPGAQAASEVADPVQVFQAWSKALRAQRRHLPLCPSCQCPTPPGELDRWQVCSLCAVKQWQK